MLCPPTLLDTNREIELLKVLKRQHVEIQQLSAPATCTLPPEKRGDKPSQQTFPAGSIVVRMDQPYSRVADALLDRQFWAPDDPQKHPYDDTGWSFSQLFNVKAVRVADPAILKANMTPLTIRPRLPAKFGQRFGACHRQHGQVSLLPLVYKLKGANIQVAEKPFDADGKHFAAGSLLITGAAGRPVAETLHDLSLDASRLSASPRCAAHAVTAPRIAFMHTWLATQTEGWWRYAFDTAGVPFAYISTQTVAKEEDLRAKYDVIIFAPVGHASALEILNGIPTWNNALPWQKSS